MVLLFERRWVRGGVNSNRSILQEEKTVKDKQASVTVVVGAIQSNMLQRFRYIVGGRLRWKRVRY